MGIAERIYELVKDLPEQQATEILGFAENVRERSASMLAAQRPIDLTLFRRYRGRYDGSRINRDELYVRDDVR
jgi:hypothetical protein